MSEPLPVVEVQVPENFPYGGSRHGTPVDTVVIHYTGGRNDDPRRVTETWTRPSSEEVREAEAAGREPPKWGREPPKWGREASAHYIINRAGVVARFMPEEWAAWHCRGQNLRGVGIECCAYLGEALTPAGAAVFTAPRGGVGRWGAVISIGRAMDPVVSGGTSSAAFQGVVLSRLI